MTIRESKELKRFDLIYIYPKDGGPRVVGKFYDAELNLDRRFVRVLVPTKNDLGLDYNFDIVGVCNIEKYYRLEEKLDALLALDKN